MEIIDFIKQPWPWYIAGPLVGLTVPTLLLIGNKTFGISSSFRHICAACAPFDIPFFQYDWKKEKWNLFFVAGIFIGAILTKLFLANNDNILVHKDLHQFLTTYGIHDYSGLLPRDLFSWQSLLTMRGFIMMVVGGFLVGFGTRYAGGCTSGHTIMGLSNLQWPSFVATICFMIGGLVMANFILPFILNL
jgi:uncharacterized membrane protein YedE/YeeE